MKAAKRKRLLKNKFYRAYRRLRFLHFRKKLLKQAKMLKKAEPKPEIIKPKTYRKRSGISFWQWIYRVYRIIRFLNHKRVTHRRLRRLKARAIRQEAREHRIGMRRQMLITRQQERHKPVSEPNRHNRNKTNRISIRRRIYRMYRILRFLRKRRKARSLEKQTKLKRERIAATMERQEIRARLNEKRLIDLNLERRKLHSERLERKELRRNRKRLIRQLLKSRLKSVFFELKTFNLYTLKRWTSGVMTFAENKDKRNNFFIITANSVVMYILSYMVVYIIGQTLTIISAVSFDYKTILFYYKIYFNIDSYQWTADSVKIIYSMKPGAGLVLGIIFIILYSIRRDTIGNLKLFYLWGFVHGMIMFFGSLLMGTMLNKDFGWVVAYMYYRDTGKMIFAIVAIFSLVIIGGFVAKSFLFSGNTYFNFINRQENKFLLASQVLWPSVIGTVLLIAFSTPNKSYFMPDDEFIYKVLRLLTLFIMLIPLIISFRTFNEIYFDEAPRKIRLEWKFLLVTLIIVVTYRLGLTTGIHIG